MAAMTNVAHLPMLQSELSDERVHFIDILMLWLETSGVIDERFEPVLPFIDILAVPADALLPDILHIGEQSLTALTLGSAKPAVMRQFIAELPKRDRVEVTTSLRHVLTTRQAAVANLHRRVLTRKDKVETMKFARLMLPCVAPVRNNKMRPVVINVSERLRSYDPDAALASSKDNS